MERSKGSGAPSRREGVVVNSLVSSDLAAAPLFKTLTGIREILLSTHKISLYFCVLFSFAVLPISQSLIVTT